MGLGVEREIAAPTAALWRLLTDVSEWPRWGPSVRGAHLPAGATTLTAGARGTVLTAVGVRLPFVVTRFEPGRRWDWAVSGVAATGHTVTPAGDGCRVRFEVPWWAGAYLPVCGVALRRLDEIATAESWWAER